MGLFFKNRTAFSFLNEADEDETSDTTNAETQDTNNEAPSPEESGDDDGLGSDDDFNIDTSLDDEGGEGGTDDSGSDDSGDLDSSDSGSAGDGEPVEANTDIFASLTAEEQQIKIKELQNLFGNLYSSTDDVLEKLNSLDTDEDNADVISRISMTLYSLRDYIREYMETSFSRKSYLENDITFNRFLSILNSVSVIIEELVKLKQEKDK